MENTKAVSTPLATHFKLSFKHSPSNEAKKINMSKVPYASTMSSLCMQWCVQDQTLHMLLRALECYKIDLEKCVALYTTKVEFIAITEACKKFLWDKYLLFCNSHSAIHLGKNSTFHSRSKHIDVRYNWICDALDVKLLELAKVSTDDNCADMMTKTLSRDKFETCCEIVGLTITST
ncbi:hypothetical protein CR513_60555, partial [Mucuna pruriens]